MGWEQGGERAELGWGNWSCMESGDEFCLFCLPVGEPDQFIKTGCGLDWAAAAGGDI